MKNANKPCVALIFGGRGYESEVSVTGADYVFSLIDRSSYTILPIFIAKDGRWLVDAKKEKEIIPSELTSSATDTEEAYPIYKGGIGGILSLSGFTPIVSAIPLLHGDFGEDGIVQGALECARIPYVGCDVCASATARDKSFVKTLAKSLGIPTSKWVCFDVEDAEAARHAAERSFEYPMFIKPSRLGSSIGASKVRNSSEFAPAYKNAAHYAKRIIIEEYIDIAKELECAYFCTKGKELFTNAGEITCDENFYDYKRKYKLDSGVRISDTAELDLYHISLIKEYSAYLAHALGLRDLSRIDFFLSNSGKLYFNEINTFPGFTSGSLYPRLVARHGIPPSELISSLIKESILRGA